MATVDWGVIDSWHLEEASGTRLAAVGGNDLTDNNTVTGNPGKVGNAAQFTAANSEYLSHADNAALSTGNVDFWSCCWVYLDSKPTNPIFVGKQDSGVEWRADYYNVPDRFRWLIRKADLTYKVVQADTFGAPSTGVWTFIMGYHDSVNNTVNVSINGGAFDSLATGGGGPVDLTDQFMIGGVVGGYMDGRIDAVVFGKNPVGGIAGLAVEIRDTLYAGGLGCEYPFNRPPLGMPWGQIGTSHLKQIIGR